MIKTNTTMRLFTLLICLISVLCITDTYAQTTVQIGESGSASSTRGPFQRSGTSSSSVYSRANLIYTQAELAEAGITPGSTITELSWDLRKSNIITASGNATLELWMQNSATTTATTDSWTNLVTGSTMVGSYTFNTMNNFPGATGWMPFTLATPFVYTGGTLEIGVDWDASGLVPADPAQPNQLFDGDGSLTWRWNATTIPSIVNQADNDPINNLNNVKSERAIIQITYNAAAPTTATQCMELGTGGIASATRGPFQRSGTNSNSVYSRANLIYTVSELAAIGITPGSIITELSWDLRKTNIITASGDATLDIYLQNSTATVAENDSWTNTLIGVNSVSGANSLATLVGSYTFNTMNNFPGTTGYMTFPIAPFVYSGGTLEVAVDWDASGLVPADPTQPNQLFDGDGSLTWRWNPTTFVSLVNQADNDPITNLNNEKSERANTKFTFAPGAVVSAGTCIFEEDFDGSNTTNPFTFPATCAVGSTDYLGVVCLDGVGCADELNSGYFYGGADGQFFGVRDQDGNSDVVGNPSACEGSLDEMISTTGIDISSCAGADGLYLCFDVAESNPATNPVGSDRDKSSNGNTDTWDSDTQVTFTASIDGDENVVTSFLRDGTVPAIDTDCDGSADGPLVSSTFTTYCFQLASLGNSLDLNIRLQNMNADGEDFAIDNIKVICGNGTGLPGALIAACNSTPLPPNPPAPPATPCADQAGCIFQEDFDGSNTTNPGFYPCEIDDSRDYLGVVCNTGFCAGSMDINSDYDYYNASGNFFGARDINGDPCGSDSPVAASFAGIDISSCAGANSLHLCFNIAESTPATNTNPSRETFDSGATLDTWDDDTSIEFLASFDGGVPLPIAVFAAEGVDIGNGDEGNNTAARLDTDCDGVGDGALLTSAFQTFCFELPELGSTLDLNISLVGLTTDGEDVAIDNIIIFCTDDVATLPATSQASCPTCMDAADPVFSTACPMDVEIMCGESVPAVPVMIATDDCGLIANAIWINEIHYDNDGDDVGEFIEIAGSAGFDLAGYEIYIYNGPFVETDAVALTGAIPNEGSGAGAIAFPIVGLMDGPLDGLALVDPMGTVINFISYEGGLTAADGPAAGMSAVNIGEEPANGAVGQSLQVSGITTLTAISWQGPLAESPGFLNASQFLDLYTTDPVEIVPVITPNPAGGETRTWTAMDAEGKTAVCTQVISVAADLAPVFTTACPGDLMLECGEAIPAAEILMATDDCGFVANGVFVNEIHYDNTGGDQGEFIEIAGTAGIDLAGYQLVLYNGNNDQVYNTMILSGVIPDEGMGAGAIAFDYPSNGIQNGAPDGLALVDPMGNVLSFLSYEGTMTADGGPADGMTSTDIGMEPGGTPVGESLQVTGATTLTSASWNGPFAESPGLLNVNQTLMLSTAGPIEVTAVTSFAGACGTSGVITRTWTATDAAGISTVCTQTITIEDNTDPTFVEALPMDETVSCAMIPMAATLTGADDCSSITPWINEFHYDNTGADMGEFIEIAGSAGTDLTGYTLELYNGSNGTVYNTTSLSGIIPDEVSGYGAIAFSIAGIQNGAPDGFALIAPGADVVEFLSYEGELTASAGAANGMTSTDVGVNQPGSNPLMFSLQLMGTGGMGGDFTWSDPSQESPNAINTGQTMSGSIAAVFTEDTVGDCVNGSTITRTWTITDACGNEDSHTQTITVEPDDAPELVCPNDIIINLDPGLCETIVNWNDPVATDDCNSDITVSQTGGPVSGSTFERNTTTTITYETSPDACGRTATCTFDVTIIEFQNPITSIACNDNIQVSIDGNCQAVIGADQVLEGGPYGCYDDYIVSINGGNNIVNVGMIGTTATYSVTDPNGNSCWGTLTIEDKIAPTIACADMTISCDDALPGAPTGADFCGLVTVNMVSETVVDNECNTAFAEVITREWEASDASGNTASCTQTIYRERAILADVVFPDNVETDCANHENDVYQNTDDTNAYTYTTDAALLGKLVSGEPTATGCGNIIVTKTDEIVPICDGSYKVIRKWKAVDWCGAVGNNIIHSTQIVKILDNTPPTVTPQPTLTVGTTSSACTGNVFLPALITTDDCSSVNPAEFSLDGNVIPNGILTNAPLGTHTIDYTVEDACGNATTGSFNIEVIDNIAPLAICDEFTQIGIGSDGITAIPANVFDDGSYDNCGIVKMDVRRMNDPCHFDDNGNPAPELGWKDAAEFCCADVGTQVMVEFRVTDAAGNVNSCMVEVLIEDKIKPLIACPAPKTISCTDDFTDLSLTGEATAIDNCSSVTPTYFDSPVIDDCGVGTISRIWSVTDDYGNPASCVQVITITNADPFFICDTEDRTTAALSIADGGCTIGHATDDDVEWPADIELNTCGLGLEPADLATNYPLDYQPQVTPDACGTIGVTKDDLILNVEGDACLKIIRTWTIIDWCQYDVNNPSAGGRWDYVQIIKVMNSEAPTVNCGNSDSYVQNFEAECGATYVNLFIDANDDCTPQADLTYSYSVENGNGTVIQTGSTNNASDAFNNGSYKVTWSVSDGCGNTTVCSHDFTVVDAKKPTPVCLNGLATVIMPTAGAVTIWANDFESGSSFDNCTPHEDLQFSFSSDVTETAKEFTCADITSGNAVPVEIWVTDGAGNQDFCLTYILVQDPNSSCSTTTLGSIQPAGLIETEEGDQIELVDVDLVGSNANLLVTGANGQYDFGQMTLPTIGTDYIITPEKNINPTNGVTTFDLVLISKHILGTQILTSPYKQIAADANSSESITTFDIVVLRRLILQIDSEFPSGQKSWRFVDAAHTFDNGTFPFPETINANTMQGGGNFVGVKIGDVNGSANTSQLLGTDTRTFNGDLVFQLEEKEVQAGEEFTVDFKAKDFNNTLGYQFTLEFDNSKVTFVDVATELTNLDEANFGLTMLEEGIITTSWNSHEAVNIEDNATIFSLTFTATETTNISDIVDINSRYTKAEAYNGSDLYDVALAFNGAIVTNDFKLYQNTPNPFKEVTTIGFNLPEAATATLKVFDVSGKVLSIVEVDGAKGYNTVELNRSQLSATGVLYYQVETANNTATMKMILVD